MKLAGYSALIHGYNLEVPLPESVSATSNKHRRYKKGKWHVFKTVQEPDQTLLGHLIFAFRYEGVDLLILKKLFETIDKAKIEAIVKDQPTGRNSRRIWFFYEWLTGDTLDVEDAQSGNYVEALDPDLQYPGPKNDPNASAFGITSRAIRVSVPSYAAQKNLTVLVWQRIR
jgi:hypothetical protein